MAMTVKRRRRGDWTKASITGAKILQHQGIIVASLYKVEMYFRLVRKVVGKMFRRLHGRIYDNDAQFVEVQ